VGSGLGMAAASSVPPTLIFLLSASCPALVLFASRTLDEPKPAAGAAAPATTLAAVRGQLSSLAGALCTPAIWRPLLFFMLQNALVPSFSQAWFFFQTDVLGFTTEFISAQGLFAYAFLLLGSAVYSRYVQGAPFLTIFYACQLFGAMVSLSAPVLVSRLNLRFGVADELFLLGSDAIETVLNRLTMQPFFVIAARLCPVGCEAALYSAFMSIYNLGNTTSGVYGAALTSWFGVEKGAYDNLLGLMLFRSASMLLPLLLIRPLLGGIEKLKAE